MAVIKGKGMTTSMTDFSTLTTANASFSSLQNTIPTHPDITKPLKRALALTNPQYSQNEELKNEQPTPQTRSRNLTNQTANTFNTFTTTGSYRDPLYEIDFTPNDPSNPKNWPLWYRSLTILFTSFSAWTVVLYSTCYTSGMPGMMADFETKNTIAATAGVSSFLIGLAVGGLILAPISEIWGRRRAYFGGMLVFALMIVPCGLARNLQTVVVCRFFGALGGAAMLSNAPGTLSDISDEQYRALAFALWSIGPLNGPVTGPVIGGLVYEHLGWRWINWIVLIFAGVSWILSATIQETYAPVILRAKAAEMRKEHSDERYWCRYEEGKPTWKNIKKSLYRPFIFFATEPILWFWDLYLGLSSAIMYLCFVAYPLIFTETRHLSKSPAVSGLVFLGIGLGTCVAIAIEPLLRRIVNSHKKDPETGRIPPEASVSIICGAALVSPIGQLIFAWTSLPATIPWIVSILAGIPFGAGNTLIFIYTCNYIAGCYGIFTASALAGNMVMRCVLGGLLPLAGKKMFLKLTPQWAGTLLALLVLLCFPITCCFYKWGHRIREKSPLIMRMREDAEISARKRERGERRMRERKAKEMNDLEMAEDGEETKPGVGMLVL